MSAAAELLLPGEAPPEPELHLLTGDENGLIKRTGFGPHAAKTSEVWAKQQAREREITSMVWKTTTDQRELLLARRDGAVEVWNTQQNDLVQRMQASAVTPVGVGYSASADALVCCSNRGVVDVWKGAHCTGGGAGARAGAGADAARKSFVVPTPAASEVLQMRLSPTQNHVIALGGKESDLKLFDINTQKGVFHAKNVPFTYLKLRVPIYIRDLQFVRSSPAAVAGNTFEVVTVSSHKHVRLYDTRAQRRPVRSVEFGEQALRALCVTPDQRSVIVADVTGRVSRLSLADFRQISVFKGAGGSVRSLVCHDDLPLLASVGLDRCVRVHHLESRRIMQRTYLRSRLNCVLFQGRPDPDGEEVESYAKLNSLDGARVVDEDVAADKGMWRKLDRNTKEMEATMARERAAKMKRKVEELQKTHGDPALRRHRFSLEGFISGDGMAAPMRVKGTLFVHKTTRKISGSYETKKPTSEGWFDPGTLSGKMLDDAGMLHLETLKRGSSVSSLQGGLLSLTDNQSLLRLAGRNLKKCMRIWKLRLVLQQPTATAAAAMAGAGAAGASAPRAAAGGATKRTRRGASADSDGDEGEGDRNTDEENAAEDWENNGDDEEEEEEEEGDDDGGGGSGSSGDSSEEER